jgi:hypothetical protein
MSAAVTETLGLDWNAHALANCTNTTVTQTVAVHFSGFGRGDRLHAPCRGYSLGSHGVVMAGRASGAALTARRFPPR